MSSAPYLEHDGRSWVYDSETLRFLAVNEAAIRNYGYSRDEFLAMTIEDIRPADDVPQLHAIVRPEGPVEARGLNTAGIWRHRRKDGTLLDADVTSHAHVFEGRAARVVLAVDVTARVEAERALRHSEARYRDLFENASDLIVMVDLESRLTMVNEAFVRALGYTREELIGRQLRELVRPDQHERLEEARNLKIGDDVDSTVYGIVKQSGGNTWIYSEPGRGSTFKVYLPAVDEPVTAEHHPRPEIAPRMGNETILVVEDEDAVRTLAADVLRRSGYTVLATGSAEEALRLAANRDEPIDLLLTDLVMPEMNGRELAEAIVERIPTVRVLFMSGYADEAVTRHGALEAGAAYLEKPFSGRDLAHMVRETLDEPTAAARQHVA